MMGNKTSNFMQLQRDNFDIEKGKLRPMSSFISGGYLKKDA